jgi:hypothetical protein
MSKIAQFFIEETFLDSVNVSKEITITGGADLKAILGSETITTIAHSTEDTPEFTQLREQLGAGGYIRIERSYWNGDRVLKPFKLNGHSFKKNDQFSCGAAMKYVLSSSKARCRKRSSLNQKSSSFG